MSRTHLFIRCVVFPGAKIFGDIMQKKVFF